MIKTRIEYVSAKDNLPDVPADIAVPTEHPNVTIGMLRGMLEVIYTPEFVENMIRGKSISIRIEYRGQ